MSMKQAFSVSYAATGVHGRSRQPDQKIMKTIPHQPQTRPAVFAATATLFLLAFGLTSGWGQDIWKGTGPNGNWTTPANWRGGVAPSPGDSLVFTNVNGLNNTNNFLTGTSFGNLTFATPSGAFVLAGNQITLNGNIADLQPVTTESINLPLSLGITPTVDIAPNGVLTINGIISGSSGLTKNNAGELDLNGANTFSGALTIAGGKVAVSSDGNLGAVPPSATPGSIVLDSGALEATTSFTLNTNRGIAVGSAGGGFGILTVDPGQTLSYGGVIADNGGAGTFTKNGYGTLTLFGQNSYSGATSNRVGALTLDFSQSGILSSNIIPATSDLTMGGQNAGQGGENEAQLNVIGANNSTNSQSFNSTHLTFAGSIIQATSGTNATVSVNLGTLSHDAGGALQFLQPSVSSGQGTITTTSPNVNGLLGGYATISDGTTYSANGYHVYYSTNFAAVDGSGNIIGFANYLTWSSGNLQGQVTTASNLLWQPASSSVITVDSANANSLTEVNTINLSMPETGTTAHYYGVYIGQGNTLRLGQYGGFLKTDRSEDVITIGGVDNSVQSGNGTSGSGDIGTLTAGGADNAPGEIVMTSDAHDETHGTTIFECKITDNGSGKVAFVKMGPGSIKLDGNNTFSGGLYLLQGRVQTEAHEINNTNADGSLATGVGLGPVYILPGSYFFGDADYTNDFFIAGSGTAAEPLGAIRDGTYESAIHLIGDARLGGGHFNGPITGPFNMGLCMPSVTHNDVYLGNPGNDWTGDTTMNAEDHSGTQTEHVYNETNEVIPNGFGRGNVTMEPGGGRTTSYIVWDLNGFNETINGLSTSGNHVEDCTITNSAGLGTNSVLTVGDNDQSGTFAGFIRDSGSGHGTLGLTKIGGGVETLTASNSYSGLTLINDGALALGSSASINNSPIQINTNGTLDITAQGGAFATAQAVGLDGGTLLGSGSVGNLNMTNGALTLDIDTAGTNIIAAALATGGTTNLINIGTILGVSKYPAYFPIIKYSGTLGGVGNNFGIGDVPTTNTVGFVSNSVSSSTIVLVLLNGPRVLTWTGTDPVNPTFWDNGITTNWLAFKGSVDEAPAAFSKGDAVIFDDTGSTGTVNVADILTPGSMDVTNNSLNYTIAGVGSLSGKFSVIKDGPGSLLLDNGGNNGMSISGSFAIANGTVQVGNGDANGTLAAAGGVADNGALVFDRTDTTTNGSSISGTGSVSQTGTGTLQLSGNNSFSGGVNVMQGTLQARSNTALGSTNGTTTVSSGATLDVGGQTLNVYPVVVSGIGIGGNGAIINSVADTTTAMGNVTLTGDTTFGGTRRWDIRGGAATLSTGGNAYNLTKAGTNYVALVGVNVDSALGDINVQAGTLSIETTTSGLGNAGNTLTLASGATFQIYAAVNPIAKQFILNGTNTTTTLNCGSGIANTLSGNVTLNGFCIFNTTSTNVLTLANGTISGGGSVLKTGPGTDVFANPANATYTGGTVVSNGTLIVDGSLSGTVAVLPGATLAGNGTVSGTVTIFNGGVSPGNPYATPQGTLTAGTLTLSNSTDNFQLGTASTNVSGNDKIVVTSALTLNGTNTLRITPTSYMSVGDAYTLVQYAGSPLPSSASNSLPVVSTRAGFSFHLLDPGSTPGFIKIGVDSALGNDFWTGASSANWDTNTPNWTRNGGAAQFNNNDYVNFNDSASQFNVSLTGPWSVSGMTMLNSANNYVFTGTGSITNSGTLQMTGGGNVTIANNGNNNFQGLITINSGILQVGNGGTGGNLGPGGTITNNGSLVFDRSDNTLAINSTIGGLGSLTNIGTGTVTLGGANTFDGEVTVSQGTLRVANGGALGDTFGDTIVNDGAALDFTNTADVGLEFITAGGDGVGGSGAILNSSGNPVFVGPNFKQLTITTNITIGGSGRLDMRASTASAQDGVLYCSPFGQPYTLIKVGTNQFQMAGVTIDPGLGNIDVQAGTFGIQWQIPDLGDPSYSLILHSNTTLNVYDLSNAVQKVFIITNATVYSQHGSNVLDGPITLSGSNTLNAANPLVLQEAIGGDGSVVKTGASTLLLNGGPISYSGDTMVNAGTLALAGPAALTNSPHIILSGATVDVSGRADDTLALGSGGLSQALVGGGTINGTLVENSGSTVNPGNGVAPAVLTVTNGVALNGNVLMDLDRSAGAVTNDEITVISNLTLTASGPLTVTNLGPTLVTGDTFQLFSVPVSGFSSVTLPMTNALHTVAYNWQNNLSVDGSITVASTTLLINTNSTNIVVNLAGGNLTLSWPQDHTGWTLQAQTNSLNAGLGTNWVDVAGSDTTNSMTIPIGTANGSVFYRLILNP